MCPSGVTCLPVDCCFSELALLKSNSACWSGTKQTSSSSHWKLTCSHHDLAEKLLNWRWTTITLSGVWNLLVSTIFHLDFGSALIWQSDIVCFSFRFFGSALIWQYDIVWSDSLILFDLLWSDSLILFVFHFIIKNVLSDEKQVDFLDIYFLSLLQYTILMCSHVCEISY